MNPGIGAAGCRGTDRRTGDLKEDLLDLALHAPSGSLTLPSDERPAVELERGEEGAAHR
jgi:hypothetical protein